MNGNVLIGLKTKLCTFASNLEHGDDNHALEAVGASDDHGFIFLP
jgi:hypothetical protein